MQEGPTTFTVNYTHKRCSLCKWHESHMLVSGMNPVYEHRCMHEKASPEGYLTSYNFFGEKGRLIGEDDKTPDWCPVLKKA